MTLSSSAGRYRQEWLSLRSTSSTAVPLGKGGEPGAGEAVTMCQLPWTSLTLTRPAGRHRAGPTATSPTRPTRIRQHDRVALLSCGISREAKRVEGAQQWHRSPAAASSPATDAGSGAATRRAAHPGSGSLTIEKMPSASRMQIISGTPPTLTHGQHMRQRSTCRCCRCHEQGRRSGRGIAHGEPDQHRGDLDPPTSTIMMAATANGRTSGLHEMIEVVAEGTGRRGGLGVGGGGGGGGEGGRGMRRGREGGKGGGEGGRGDEGRGEGGEGRGG